MYAILLHAMLSAPLQPVSGTFASTCTSTFKCCRAPRPEPVAELFPRPRCGSKKRVPQITRSPISFVAFGLITRRGRGPGDGAFFVREYVAAQALVHHFPRPPRLPRLCVT